MFFEKQGEAWVEVGYALGLDFDQDGRAVAPIDVDGDGDLDLALLSLQGLKLLRNEAKPRNWLRLTLTAKGSERHALGARVVVAAGGTSTVDRVRLTGGFHAQTSPELHFGLADATVAKVTIHWPSGRTQTVAGLAANTRYTIEEGAPAVPRALHPWPADAQPRTARFSLAAPVLTADGTQEALTPSSRLHVVNFWAPWCAACEREVPALAALAAKGIPVTGVSVEVKDRAQVAQFAAKHGLTYRNRFATDAVIASFFGADGKVTLPATFVFDAGGQLRRSFYREVRIDEIEDALRVESGTARDRWMLAQLAAREGDGRRAAKLLRQAERLGADDPAALHEIGRVYLMLGQTDAARQVAERGLERSGDDAELLLLRAEAQARGGQLAAAETDVNRALEITPDHRDALVNKGLLLKARGELGEAALRFERALTLDPRAEPIKRLLAETRAAMGE